MSEPTRESRTDTGASSAPEKLLRVLVGAYIAFLIAPLGPLLLALSSEKPVYWLPVLIGIGLTTGILATYAVSEREELVDEIVENDRDFALLVLTIPLVYFFLFVIALRSGVSTKTAEVFVPIMIGFFGVIPGLLISILADVIHTRRLVEKSEIHAEWTALPAPKRRWYMIYGGLLFVVAGGVGEFSGFLGLPITVLTVLVGLLIIFDARHSRRYIVTDAGLRVRDIGVPYLYSWNSFKGYKIEDGVITVKRKRKFRWDNEAFDLEGVENAEEVEEALSGFLEKIET